MTSSNHRSVMLTSLAWALIAGSTTPASGYEIETHCIARELEDVAVPARREGTIEKLLVRRGVRVRKGQLLSAMNTNDKALDLQVVQAEIKQAETQARDDGPVLASEASVDRAKQEMHLMQELGDDAVYLERFRSENSLKRAIAELKTSVNRREQSRLQVAIKRREAAVLENDIAQMQVHSPVDGVVLQVKKHQGEWVHRGEPMLVVTRMDRLLVEGFLDSRDLSPSEIIGSPASVTFHVARGKTVVFEGLVVSNAAPKLELDGKFPVWVEFNNRLVHNAESQEVWLIRPGMKAKMTISLRKPSDLVSR